MSVSCICRVHNGPESFCRVSGGISSLIRNDFLARSFAQNVNIFTYKGGFAVLGEEGTLIRVVVYPIHRVMDFLPFILLLIKLRPTDVNKVA